MYGIRKLKPFQWLPEVAVGAIGPNVLEKEFLFVVPVSA
jgi:hypothetical protein